MPSPRSSGSFIDTQYDLSNMTLPNLKSMAKERGITGYNRLSKWELIDVLTRLLTNVPDRSPARSPVLSPSNTSVIRPRAIEVEYQNVQRNIAEYGSLDYPPEVLGKIFEASDWNPEIRILNKYLSDFYQFDSRFKVLITNQRDLDIIRLFYKHLNLLVMVEFFVPDKLNKIYSLDLNQEQALNIFTTPLHDLPQAFLDAFGATLTEGRLRHFSTEGISILANDLKTNTSLVSLNLNINFIDDEGIAAIAEALKVNKTLKYLDLSDNNFGDAGLISLTQALLENTTLTTLILKGNFTDNAAFIGFVESLRENKSLTSLTVFYNSDQSSNGAIALANLVEENDTIKFLSISDHNMTNENLIILSNALRDNSSITALELSFLWVDGFNSLGITAFANILQTNRTLTSITIRKAEKNLVESPDFGDEIVIAIDNALRGNRTLISLNLENINFGTAGASASANILRITSSIESLSLEENMNIGNEGIDTISDALRDNKTLRYLNLRKCGINSENVIGLARALEGNVYLNTLDLHGNEIGDDGAIALANSLYDNHVLTTLDLSQNKIGNEGAIAFAEALCYNNTLITLDLRKNNYTSTGINALTPYKERVITSLRVRGA